MSEMQKTVQTEEVARDETTIETSGEKKPPIYDEVMLNSLCEQLFERDMTKFPGQVETTDKTKGLSVMSKQAADEAPHETGLIGEFTNPWDGRNWKVIGMRTRRAMDGIYTVLVSEYDVIRLPKKFSTFSGPIDELWCRERREHVLKVCRKDDKGSHDKFYHECKVFQEMRARYQNYRQSRHFPAIFGEGLFEQMCFKTGRGWRRVYNSCKMDVPRPFFIQERLDPNLETVMKMTRGAEVNSATAAYLTIGMIKALRLLHMAGYCQRRVMPCSFGMRLPLDQMVVRNEAELTNYVALIDVAVARKYKELKPRKVAPFVGTIKYSSVNAMEMFEQTAVDDLVSIFYIFLEMVTESLPWHGKLDKQEVIKDKKATQTQGSQKFGGFADLFKILLESNGFLKMPDYERIYTQLREMTENAKLDFALFGNRREVKKQYMKDVLLQKPKAK